MINSDKWEHLLPYSPLPSAKPPPSPKGKAETSSVGKADTFPEREGKDLFRRQSRHLPRKGRLFAERDQYYFRENCRDFYTV